MSAETAAADSKQARRRPARRGEGSQLREEIVDAAGREIARTGDANALTLRGVARDVGVAATSIYLHFENVGELVEEVKRCRFGDLQRLLREAADEAGGEPVARIKARCHAYMAHGREHPGEYAVMFTARFVAESSSAPSSVSLEALDDLETDLRTFLVRSGTRD